VCEEKRLAFNYTTQGELFVLADRDLIAQAMSNLMDNAVKYTPEGGAIRLEVKRGADSTVELIVADSGPGIPVEDRERAVERFVRLEQSRSQPGSGLGLSLAAAVAEAHTGKLILGDSGGPPARPGLSVTLQLPAV
ncbi:MAG: ATP-binding protein, partial [Alphaproteobacteria bacterium]